jgi:hypothetical protein
VLRVNCSFLSQQLEEMGKDVKLLLKEIRAIIVKTIISAQAKLAFSYRNSVKKDELNELCFEILG